ncbi:MAG: hypothetical protein Q7R95_09625, partial [bacterium]|nr:hypothetical protein [bacterium]
LLGIDIYPIIYFDIVIKSVTTNLIIIKNNLYVFDQSYDDAWKAYEMQSQNSKVKTQIFNLFPFIFGTEIKEHVLVNNWANAWRLEETPKSADQTLREPSTDSSEKANGKLRRRWNNSTIVIIFWPQYLEFLGFGLLIIGFFIMIKYKYEERN